MSHAHISQVAPLARSAHIRDSSEPHAEPVAGHADFAHTPRRHETVKLRKALLRVTVEEADVFVVRRALAGGRVEFLKLTRIPGKRRVRLQIGLDARSVGEAMSRIIGCVDAAELGRITFA